VSVFAVVLLAAAVVLLAAAEWPRLQPLVAFRPRRRTDLRLVREDDESDDFARAVERDLAALPTIDEQDLKRRR
jgi:hypothetical protein